MSDQIYRVNTQFCHRKISPVLPMHRYMNNQVTKSIQSQEFERIMTAAHTNQTKQIVTEKKQIESEQCSFNTQYSSSRQCKTPMQIRSELPAVTTQNTMNRTLLNDDKEVNYIQDVENQVAVPSIIDDRTINGGIEQIKRRQQLHQLNNNKVGHQKSYYGTIKFEKWNKMDDININSQKQQIMNSRIVENSITQAGSNNNDIGIDHQSNNPQIIKSKFQTMQLTSDMSSKFQTVHLSGVDTPQHKQEQQHIEEQIKRPFEIRNNTPKRAMILPQNSEGQSIKLEHSKFNYEFQSKDWTKTFASKDLRTNFDIEASQDMLGRENFQRNNRAASDLKFEDMNEYLLKRLNEIQKGRLVDRLPQKRLQQPSFDQEVRDEFDLNTRYKPKRKIKSQFGLYRLQINDSAGQNKQDQMPALTGLVDQKQAQTFDLRPQRFKTPCNQRQTSVMSVLRKIIPESKESFISGYNASNLNTSTRLAQYQQYEEQIEVKNQRLLDNIMDKSQIRKLKSKISRTNCPSPKEFFSRNNSPQSSIVMSPSNDQSKNYQFQNMVHKFNFELMQQKFHTQLASKVKVSLIKSQQRKIEQKSNIEKSETMDQDRGSMSPNCKSPQVNQSSIQPRVLQDLNVSLNQNIKVKNPIHSRPVTALSTIQTSKPIVLQRKQVKYEQPKKDQIGTNEQISQYLIQKQKDTQAQRQSANSKLGAQTQEDTTQEKKFTVDDIKMPQMEQIKKSEALLKELYPSQDELWIQLSKIINKEVSFIQDRQQESLKINEPYQFEKYHISDCIQSSKDFQSKIVKLVQQLAPNLEFYEKFKENIDKELKQLSIEQLMKMRDILELILKYENKRSKAMKDVSMLMGSFKESFKLKFNGLQQGSQNTSHQMFKQINTLMEKNLAQKANKIQSPTKTKRKSVIGSLPTSARRKSIVGLSPTSPRKSIRGLSPASPRKSIVGLSPINLRKNIMALQQVKTQNEPSPSNRNRRTSLYPITEQPSVVSPNIKHTKGKNIKFNPPTKVQTSQNDNEKDNDVGSSESFSSHSSGQTESESDDSQDSEEYQGEQQQDYDMVCMSRQIKKMITLVRKRVGINYFEQKREKEMNRRKRQKVIEKYNDIIIKKSQMQDIIYTVYMLGFKEVLSNCFNNEPLTLGQVTKKVDKLYSNGIFTNTVIEDILKKVDIPISNVTHFIVPGPYQRIPSLTDQIMKLESRYGMLNQPTMHSINTTGFQRILPLIKTDGTLNIIERMIDREYAGQIDQFLLDVIREREYLNRNINRVLIEGIGLEQQYLISILSCFEDKRTGLSAVKNLTIGNVKVSPSLIDFIFQKIMPSLYSFDIFNIKCVGGLKEQKMFERLEQRIDDSYYRSNLMRLRISHIDLSKQTSSVIILIRHSKLTLIDLDLSWCNLNFQNFKSLCECIKLNGFEDAENFNGGKKRGSLRSINFSYNPGLKGDEHLLKRVMETQIEDQSSDDQSIDIQDEKVSQKGSVKDDDSDNENEVELNNFSEVLINLIQSQYLNKCTHLELSGINAIDLSSILEIMSNISDYKLCSNLLSVHLNDLGINSQSQISEEIMDLFQIQTKSEQKYNHQGGLYTAFRQFMDNMRGAKYFYEQAEKMNYVNVVKNALAMGDAVNAMDKEHNRLMGLHMSILSEQKMLRNAGFLSNCYGIGRSTHLGSNMDKFVLSRKNNLPELVFNQNAQQDINNKCRYFEIDHEMKWALNDNSSSSKDICYICEKQKYCMIFYQRDKLGFMNQRKVNPELVEITDPVFLRKLKQEFKFKYSQNLSTLKQMSTPLICGTIIRNNKNTEKVVGDQKRISNMCFDRKLRMMRADIFSLLGVSTNGDFIQKSDLSVIIKQSIMKFLESELNDRVAQMEIWEQLQGWNKLLHQKCNHNEILQIHSLNQPECVRNPNASMMKSSDSHYVFAGFAEPGYHQYIIYDPLIEKAFCQETVIEFNHYQLIYPELPKLNENLQKMRVLPPVFKKWIRDDIERENKAYYSDTTPIRNTKTNEMDRDNFEPERFIKDKNDIQKCEQLLKQNFKYIQALFLQCISTSLKYPEIDLQTYQEGIKKLLEFYNKQNEKEYQMNISPVEIEVQFISATRHDDKTDRSLGRGEFLELMVRMANIKFRQVCNELVRKKLYRRQTEQPKLIKPEMQKSAPERRQSKNSFFNNKQRSEQKISEPDSSLNQVEPNKKVVQPSFFRNLNTQINKELDQVDKQSDVSRFLSLFINKGLIPYCEQAPVLKMRRQIQDDPLVERAIALRLKELKKVFEQYCFRNQFRFQQSALKLFEMDGMTIESKTDEEHFWYPLTPKDLRQCFILSMMTILDDVKQKAKYNHIYLVEFYDWIGRVAFRAVELGNPNLASVIQASGHSANHDLMADFLEVFLSRVSVKSKTAR